MWIRLRSIQGKLDAWYGTKQCTQSDTLKIELITNYRGLHVLHTYVTSLKSHEGGPQVQGAVTCLTYCSNHVADAGFNKSRAGFLDV